MLNQNRTKPRTNEAKRDIGLFFGILAVWLIPWAVLTVAAKMAGANPQGSPFSLFDISRIEHDYSADGGMNWLHLVNAYGAPNMFVFYATLVVVVGILGFAAMSLWTALRGGSQFGLAKYFAPKSLSRNSRWANTNDLRALRSRTARNGCLTVGRRGKSLIVTEKETSLLVVGPTRSGKTSGLIIPNLFEWDGPAIVTSTKSELVDITGGYRQGLGPVYVYDPTGEISDQYQSVTWSPIMGCEDLDYAWQVASWLAAGLQAGKSGGDNDWRHWAESGKLLMAPLLYVAAMTERNIVDVKTWILSIDLGTPMALLQEMLADEEFPEQSNAERALTMLTSIDQRPDKERGTVFSTVTGIFNVFNERAVERSAMTSRFNAREFLKRKGTLYLCTPARQPERVASLFVGILMTVVTEAYIMSNKLPRGRLDPELGLFLDELANVVPIEDLPSMASQGAGRGVILMSVVQDMSQLRTRYGPDKANSILNNHGGTIVLPGIRDPETTEQIAKMVGRMQYTETSVSRQEGKENPTYSLKQDQMATPDALRQLQQGTAIMVYRDKPPTIVRLRPWYLDGTFQQLAKRRFFKNADYVSTKRSA